MKEEKSEWIDYALSFPFLMAWVKRGWVLSPQKKIGNAVARNRVKRRIREVFRHIKHRMEPALDIVVISGKDMVTLPHRVIEKKLSNALLAER